ncbi:MAG TPA: S53 family peptidase [Candidatus Binatia bacterium]|nr:S53 family peptidase [Candidatus Binatia bacterium]
MTAEKPVPIAGTHRTVWPGATAVASLADGDALLTAWLRPREGGELDAARARQLGATPPARRVYASRAELAQATDADPDDVDLLKSYCAKMGLDVVGTHWRSVTLSGPIAKLVEVFGATASIYELPDKRRFRHRSESLHAPSEIAAMVRGPFGIHQWPRSHAIGTLQPHTTPLSAQDVAARYEFPDGDGSGQTVGLIQLRGTFKPDDFTKCMTAQGVTAKLPVVKRVDNAEIAHAEETEKDVESAIDTQIVGALAPGAQIVVYAAPDDERGVLDAVRAAIFDDENRPSILSISFGFPEQLWTPVALTILDELFTAAALLGISVFCAAGDNGAELDAAGNAHVLAPASSPLAHACGGTQLVATDNITTEVAWPKTGGGFSEKFGAAAWQGTAALAAGAYHAAPGRGLPDFAAQVMPGYAIVFEGTALAAGGTSAAAPMWSALVARINQRLGAPAGFIAPLLYAASATLFRDVTSGGNDRYQSAVGWNPCTGLGVPIGTAIDAMLRGSS